MTESALRRRSRRASSPTVSTAGRGAPVPGSAPVPGPVLAPAAAGARTGPGTGADPGTGAPRPAVETVGLEARRLRRRSADSVMLRLRGGRGGRVRRRAA